MHKGKELLACAVSTIIGSAVFAAGFSLFLLPAEMNAGGISGVAMLIHQLADVLSVGSLTFLLNLPLFLLAGIRVGKRFFAGSALGAVASSAFVDLLSSVSMPKLEPLLCCIYGGVICGLGLGIVFSAGTSTGGSDIGARLLKKHFPDAPMGNIIIAIDVMIAVLTGIVFRDITKTLYSGITIFLSGQVLDIVIYRFDYSKVALIITQHYEEVAQAIGQKLDRGATFLNGEGSYTHVPTKVVLTVVRRRQLAVLKALVMDVDPGAFVIVQEAHQVMGKGFSRYHRYEL